MTDIQQLLKLTIERGASDLHIIVGYYPTLRINGELVQLKTAQLIEAADCEAIIQQILTESQKENFLVNRESDFGYNVDDSRFRVNAYYTRMGPSLSFRLIPKTIRTPEELGLPAIVHEFVNLRQGFILVTGPTGEGKSTTLAAIINEINNTHAKHILTIEDPIEFIYPSSKSIISQRELGQDTHSWTIALRSALREDPDVALIGEMRDYETIQAALTVAETGHLVFSTVHTNSAAQTIDRIIDVFPPHQQQQIRIQLASTLKAVVSQRLLPEVSNQGRVVAVEMLINTPAVSALIRDGKTNLIDNVIQTSSEEGMIYFERNLHELYTAGKISKDVAQAYALRPNEITKLIG